QHGEALGPLLRVAQEGQRRSLDALAGRPFGDRLDDAIQDVLDLPVDHDRVEPLLASEVLVHDRLGDAGALGDLLDRRRLVAALREQPTSDLDQLCAPRRRREAWPASRGCVFAHLTSMLRSRKVRNRNLRDRNNTVLAAPCRKEVRVIAVSASPSSPLDALEPVVAKLLDRHLDAAREWFPHEYVPWEQGRSFAEHPWQESDSRLDATARTALELNLLTEDNLPYYHLALWNVFGGQGAWGEWARRWPAEEPRHSIAIRDYLITTRAVDPVALERERMEHVARGYYPRGIDGPLDALVYVTLQELATRIAHRNTGT